MTEFRLAPLCATGGPAPRSIVLGNVTITEVPDIAIASVAKRAGGASALTECARVLTGTDVPGPRRVAGSAGSMQFMWTGPEQWFVLAPLDGRQVLADDLAARLRGAASVTEQTDGWACFAVEGSGTAALLERLCALDIARMEAGMADRTGIEHMSCFVICDAPGACYRVLGARSSALSLFEALSCVARGLA
ncbi:sarcosine oxidase subunit gamma [Meridianimarinicoccus aquatilis]|uniref:sarcosine oxidase subunit gamma n=1 Tax=Meridianimarinicoccus aquatilis TaxID=2552766 RepID=UPI001404C18B|nr:sarcosine oxidase subunit gamma [Fluviibacterium aquatile]